MNTDLIIGKIAIWIGIVVQICYNVVIVSMTTFIFFINTEGASPEIAVLIALVIILILTLPPILTVINLENKMEVKGTLFIVYAIVAFCMFNYLSSMLWVVCGIFLFGLNFQKMGQQVRMKMKKLILKVQRINLNLKIKSLKNKENI